MDGRKRIYTSLIAAALVASSFPAAVFAEEKQEEATTPDTAVVQAEPETPANPETSAEPETPANPETPADPETPANPETSTDPETPANPETPAEPETPANPETPAEPETPANPETPTDPETPANPETPADPDKPDTPEETEKVTLTFKVNGSEDIITINPEDFDKDKTATYDLNADTLFPCTIEYKYTVEEKTEEKTDSQEGETPKDEWTKVTLDKPGTIEIGDTGYSLKITSTVTVQDPNKPDEKGEEANVIYSITAKVGEHTINATMKEPDFVPYTLRPAAKTVHCYIDLSEISYEEFIKSKLYLSAEADEGKTVLWDWDYENGKRLPDESFRPIGNGSIDCKNILPWNDSLVTLRVGEKQLEEDEFVKYEVQFVNVPSDYFNLTAIAQFEGNNGRLYRSTDEGEDANGTITYKVRYNPVVIEKGYFWLDGVRLEGYDYTAYEGHNATLTSTKVDGLFQDHYSQGEGYELKEITNGKKYDFTIVCTPRDEANPNKAITKNITLICEENIPDVRFMYRLYDSNSQNAHDYIYSRTRSVKDNAVTFENELPHNYSLKDQFRLSLEYSNKGIYLENDEVAKAHAVIGDFSSWEEAQKAIEADKDNKDKKDEEKLTDIGSSLLTSEGYLGTFAETNKFTVFIPEKIETAKEGTADDTKEEEVKYSVYHVTVKLSAEQLGVEDGFWGITGVDYDKIYTPNWEDESGKNSGLAFILVDDANLDLTSIAPRFGFYNVDLYVGYKDEKNPGTLQTSGESPQDFSKGPVKYTAVAKNGTTFDYWLSVVKKTEKPDIYVVYGENANERNILMENYVNESYDIFIANTGAEALKNVKVELKNAQNVKLDDYWNVSEPATLLGFDRSSRNDYRTMDGIAKIRLLPTGKGTVSGTLIISADGIETKEIKLTGKSNFAPSSPTTPTNPNRPTGGYDYDDDDDDDSSSSGGSGSRGTSSSSTSAATTVEQQQAAVTSAVQKAVQQQTNSDSTQLFVRVKNVNTVTAETLKKVASEARKAGKTPVLNVDTMKGNQVDVRVSIDPSLATTDLNLAGYTDSQRAASTKATFENYFSNRIIATINLAQKDTFGQTASVCVRVPAGTDVKDLRFYSYKSNTNSYRRIQNPKAWIDQNNFIHFETEYASDIIITVGDLVLR